MKKLWLSIIMTVFAFGVTPALSDEAWQTYECRIDSEGDATEDDVIAAAEKWLAAARKVPGGEKLELRVLIPHAAASAHTDFLYVLWAPSFESWGRFWDNYEGTEAHKIDEESDEITDCPSSRLFESVRIKAK
jgi:hypothetical protein